MNMLLISPGDVHGVCLFGASALSMFFSRLGGWVIEVGTDSDINPDPKIGHQSGFFFFHVFAMDWIPGNPLFLFICDYDALCPDNNVGGSDEANSRKSWVCFSYHRKMCIEGVCSGKTHGVCFSPYSEGRWQRSELIRILIRIWKLGTNPDSCSFTFSQSIEFKVAPCPSSYVVMMHCSPTVMPGDRKTYGDIGEANSRTSWISLISPGDVHWVSFFALLRGLMISL